MARGWESKSVEEQMASSQQYAPVDLGANFVSEDARREAEHQRAQRLRQKQALNLQKENILSQRTSNPARRSALEAALRQIEAQIAELN
jgi:transcriptional regulator GlxA family with amidase domain